MDSTCQTHYREREREREQVCERGHLFFQKGLHQFSIGSHAVARIVSGNTLQKNTHDEDHGEKESDIFYLRCGECGLTSSPSPSCLSLGSREYIGEEQAPHSRDNRSESSRNRTLACRTTSILS